MSTETVIENQVVSHWIGGATRAPTGGRRRDIHDPATGSVVRQVELGDKATVNAAVAAASEAADSWGDTPLPTRVRLLRRWSELIAAHRDEFIQILGQEQGKVKSDAVGEIARGLETLDIACAAPLLIKGEVSEQVTTGLDVASVRAPLGVCAAITPFNFPFMAPVYLSSIALACGNTYLLKPSERVPSASILLAELSKQAGFPDGVFNVIQGDAVVVDAILDNPAIEAVSFVGSTQVAKHVYTRGSAAGKRVQAFGGAKNHMVVMPDADLAGAADAAVSAAFGSSGQRCMAVSVVVAVEPCADELVALIAERLNRLRIGPAVDNDAEMGPLVSAEARDRVVGAITTAERAGAVVVADGRNCGHPDYPNGYFVGPTLLDRVTADLEVYRREVFGPVLCVVRTRSLDEALALIAATPFGNGASVFTASGSVARTFQRRASAGMVGINVPIPIPNAAYSFGGWKSSRFGDQHMAGTEGFRFYTRQKVITSRWPESTEALGVELAFPGR